MVALVPVSDKGLTAQTDEFSNKLEGRLVSGHWLKIDRP